MYKEKKQGKFLGLNKITGKEYSNSSCSNFLCTSTEHSVRSLIVINSHTQHKSNCGAKSIFIAFTQLKAKVFRGKTGLFGVGGRNKSIAWHFPL